MNVALTNRAEVDHLVMSHYLHSWPGVVTSIYGLYDDSRPIGVIVFALPPRETARRYAGPCWELARLFIVDGTPKNTESWFIAKTIKAVRVAHPDLLCIVSYADSSHHKGTIYRASNWIFDGWTDANRKTPRFDLSIGDVKYSRASHVPEGALTTRIARSKKRRFVFWLDGLHEQRRQLKVL